MGRKERKTKPKRQRQTIRRKAQSQQLKVRRMPRRSKRWPQKCLMKTQSQTPTSTNSALKSFAIVVEDGGIDSLDAELVDFAFGAAAISQTSAGSGGVRYLSLSGFGKPEKSVKVQRYSDIVLSIASQISKQ